MRIFGRELKFNGFDIWHKGNLSPVKDSGNTPELKSGLESAKPMATGSGIIYFATDTQKIYKDTASGQWTQMGGQDLPIASNNVLGGIKVGTNLLITEDGTLSAIDSDQRSSFIIKQEIFIASEGQSVFNLTKGSYQPNTNTISVYIYGGKQPNIVINEISMSSFEIIEPLHEGNVLIVEYFELSSATPYPIHGSDHLTGGYDPIPLVTALSDGLMAKGDKVKLNTIETGANKYTHPNTHSISIITETTDKKILTATERSKITEIDNKVDNNRVLTDVPIDAKFTDTIVDISGKADKSYVDSVLNDKVDNSRVLTDVPMNAKFTDTTYSEITTAEIDTGTASTLRTITGRRIKYILDKVTTMISSLTKSDVGLGNVDNVSDLNKPISTATQLALNNKVDNSRVLTDVPTNAKFTDTVYTHPTTAGNKHIPTGGVVGQVLKNTTSGTATWQDEYSYTHPSSHNISEVLGLQSALDGKVDDSQVLTNVPVNAKFTDTIYTHPTGDGNLHVPATGTSNNGKVLKAGATAGSLIWGVDNDTITTINGKTGVISKADIVAIGIPSQDTIYTHPSTHAASMIVESTTRRFASDVEKSKWNGKAEVSDIPTNVSQLTNDSNYVTQSELGDAGFGDMVKSIYDTNNNGIVDNAEKLGGQLPSYYQQALGYTPVNKAGDTLNGSYTGNGKLFLKNSFYGMGGQALSDFSMSGIYNRQELINVAHKGGVEVNIEGAGSVSRTKDSLNLMFNGEPDFLNISGVNTTTTKIEIIADLGSRAEVYSDATWQPFVQLRIAPGGSHNWFNKIRVEVSDDKVNWSYPDDETAWGTNDFLNNQAIPSLWMGKNASPKPSYLWRYIRFIFTEIRGTSGNFWISQLGMRHRNAPYTKKYVTATGDKMYGVLDMNSNKISNVASPTNINDVATKKYVDDKNVIHIGTSAPSDTNTVWIDTSL